MHSFKALRHGSHSFTCKLHHACLSFVSVHQMAPPLAEVADNQFLLTTHLSTPKGWKAELAWLVDLQRMVCPHKCLPVSYRLSAGQGKFAGQRSTFYRCATQPAADNVYSGMCLFVDQVHQLMSHLNTCLVLIPQHITNIRRNCLRGPDRRFIGWRLLLAVRTRSVRRRVLPAVASIIWMCCVCRPGVQPTLSWCRSVPHPPRPLSSTTLRRITPLQTGYHEQCWCRHRQPVWKWPTEPKFRMPM